MVFGRKVEAGIVRGHKNWHEVEMGVANKITSSVLDREHAARAFAHKKHANQLVFNGMWRKKAARIVIGP